MDQAKTILVTGASKGLGRGMARGFGKTGATVYLTSRASSQDELARVAEEVAAAGGRAVTVAVDHADSDQVGALMEAIKADTGRLDILVNNAAIVHPQLATPGSFWEKPIELGDMIEVPLHAAYITAWHAAPLMVAQGSGLIANISFYGAVSYHYGPAYGAAKAGTDKMTFDMASELAPHGVACVSIWPGLIYTDMLADFVETAPPEHVPDWLKAQLPDFEKPEFTALVIDALHSDPDLMRDTGQALIGAELGTRYGIADIDGKRPKSYRDSMGSPIAFFPAAVRK